MKELTLKVYSVDELLPEHGKSVMVWRDGWSRMYKGYWCSSKCHFTTLGPRWECDEGGPIPIPECIMRSAKYWAELPEGFSDD